MCPVLRVPSCPRSVGSKVDGSEILPSGFLHAGGARFSMIKTLVLTGGIASGKSTTLKYFRVRCPSWVFFDCDEVARRIVDRPAVLTALEESLRVSLRNRQGELDRAVLRSLVFEDPQKRLVLEELVHPLVRKELLEEREKVIHSSAATKFMADIPLYYEGNLSLAQDLTLVVGVSRLTQRERLQNRNQFSEPLVDRILAAQLPLEEKVQSANVVFWNEGSITGLHSQVDLFLSQL